MKSKIYLLAVSLLFIFSLERAAAAPPPPPEEIQKAITSFFNLLKEKKVDEAYDLILANTKIKGREEEVKGLKNQTRDAITYGPILSFEIIEQRRVGMNLIQVVCLSLSDEFPLRWRFTYYRPADKWRLLDIFVDEKVAELFETPSVKTIPADRSK